MKWPVFFIGVVLVAAVLIFAISYGPPSVSNVSTSTSASTTEIIPGTLSVPYTNTEQSFTILRPETVEVRTTGFEGYLPLTAHPVAALVFPTDLFQGTNLVEAG